MFYYEQMFNTALSGVLSAGLMSTILTVAYGILLASLLFSAYEAWTKGGDVRALGVAGVKYLALGALFMNDGAVYERVFRDVLGAFNQMSHTMAGAGPSDVFNAWRNDLFAYGATTGTFLNLVTAGMPALLSALLLLIAMIFYPVAYGGRGPGDFRSPNIPHAAGWLGGTVAGMAMRGGQNAVAAGRKMLAGDGQPTNAPATSAPPQRTESVDEWV